MKSRLFPVISRSTSTSVKLLFPLHSSLFSRHLPQPEKVLFLQPNAPLTQFRFNQIAKHGLILGNVLSSSPENDPVLDFDLQREVTEPEQILKLTKRHIAAQQPKIALEYLQQGLSFADAKQKHWMTHLPDLWFAKAYAEQMLDLDQKAAHSVQQLVLVNRSVHQTLQHRITDYVLLAVGYIAAGDLKNGITHYRIAVNIAEAMPSSDSQIADRADLLGSLGILYYLNGELSRAIPCCEESHALYRDLPNKKLMLQGVHACNLMNLHIARSTPLPKIVALQEQIGKLLLQIPFETTHPLAQRQQQISKEGEEFVTRQQSSISGLTR